MSSPADARDTSDPGDQTIRKFRYQHAYGVVLAVTMATKKLDYVAIWCEQHEDFLAEKPDGFFDAYQVKTRRAETGEWEINDEAFYKSVKRFVDLDAKFPGKMSAFKFVSNAEFSDSVTRAHYSPMKLLQGVKSAVKYEDLLGDSKSGFDFLVEKINVSAGALFLALKRTDIVLSLTERAFEDEICHRHISTLPECRSMSAPRLNQVMEELIARIERASSLVATDPSRDYVGLTDPQADPYLAAKRIRVEDITLCIRNSAADILQYLPEFASIQLGALSQNTDILRKKMIRGGLSGSSYEVMRQRSIMAEQHLLELVTRLPDEKKATCAQIESVVLGECADAQLRAQRSSADFGPAMLIDVQDRLREISETLPAKVHQQPYEILVGVAGLLTSECKVWWSPPFRLEDQP